MFYRDIIGIYRVLGFLKTRGTILEGAQNEDYNIFGSILGSFILGHYYIQHIIN